MSYFHHLTTLPADPLLGLMAAARSDQRPDTLDVSVGVYRDEQGSTPIMSAVRKAQKHLAATETTKAYEGQRGNRAFCESIETLALGIDLRSGLADRLTSMVTPGGTGALWLAQAAVGKASPAATVWLSDPTWANHRHIAVSAGLTVGTYAWLDRKTGRADAQAAMADLQTAIPGDAVVIQGPCHNPTGADLTIEQWKHLAAVVREQQMLPIVDIAYHGLGAPLDEDLAGVRALVEAVPECLICYSCSKNFGLYRDRVGALIAVTSDSERSDALASHLASLTRAVWSMPPAHGAALVDIVLRTPEFCQNWTDEVNHMRARLGSVRVALCDALTELGCDGAFVTRQKGMFSLLPLEDGATGTLRAAQAIYLPASGRINVAALGSDTIRCLAEAVAPFLRLESR